MEPKRSSGVLIHAITAKNTSDDVLSRVLALSKSIFATESSEDAERPSNQITAWQERIQEPESLLLFATDQSAPEKPTGLLFLVPRTAPEIGMSLPHVWLAGVDPTSRGSGIFALLMKEAVQHASAIGYHEMTVCTYPARFGKMYRILQETGWQFVSWRENGAKVLMKLAI